MYEVVVYDYNWPPAEITVEKAADLKEAHEYAREYEQQGYYVQIEPLS